MAGMLGTQAQFVPVPLAPGSFNQDMVVQATAPRAALGATTASMDGGPANTGNSWYEQGYNLGSPDTGLPPAGTTLASVTFPQNSYQLPPSYTAPNAILVNAQIQGVSLTLNNPVPLSALSFLTASGNGPFTVTYTIHHADGTSTAGNFVSPDWFNNPDPAWTASGRVNVASGAFDAVGSANPSLHTVDVPVANTASPVARVEFSGEGGGGGRAVIMAVSGAATAGAGFAPLAVSGYNFDVVVEATARQPITELGATTASMDAGLQNTGFSWYEQGYATNAPATGLPLAGTTFTNITASDHVYTMAASYTANNAILVNVESSGTAQFVSPAAFSAISILGSAGGGAVTIAYTVNFTSGQPETGTFVVPDWFNAPNPALIAGGRVNVANGGLDNVGAQNPRLYAIDITLQNTTTPIASIDFLHAEGGGNAAIFAISGATGAGAPTIVTQPLPATVLEGTAVQLAAEALGGLPLTYRWQRQVGESFVDIADAGNISGAGTATLTIANPARADAGTYRVAATNPAGTTFSAVAQVRVLSGLQSVLSPGDPIEAFGGPSPGNEPVENAIDQTTNKYLNFGTDGDTSPPFVGPVGFVVSPALGVGAGGTLVTAMRVYTANDATERDPTSYIIEGSNDGVNFTQVTSGVLDLPLGRNPSGQELNPLTQFVDEVHFQNSMPYATYRVSFLDVRNAAGANSMQVGEVELLGTIAPDTAALMIARNPDGTLTITTSRPAILQSTPVLNGAAWTTVGPIEGSITVTPTGQAMFYRVVPQ
jgi:hypothetical protein